MSIQEIYVGHFIEMLPLMQPNIDFGPLKKKKLNDEREKN